MHTGRIIAPRNRRETDRGAEEPANVYTDIRTSIRQIESEKRRLRNARENQGEPPGRREAESTRR